MKIGPAEAAGSKTGVRVRRGSACALVLSAFDLVLCPGECLRPLSSVICRPFQPVSFCSQPSTPKPLTTPGPAASGLLAPVQGPKLDVGCWMLDVQGSMFKVQGSRFKVRCWMLRPCVPASLRPISAFQHVSLSAFQHLEWFLTPTLDFRL